MSMITIDVVDQSLMITNAPMISAGDIKTDYVKFTFDSVWNNYGKTAVFYRDDNKENIYEVALDANNEAVVPHEVTQEDGKIWIGVVGVKSNGQTITSEVIWYEIVEGVYTGAMASRSAEASIYARILEVLEAMKAAVGSPLTASTAAAMTNKTKIYVYTGSESGYTNGNWYYYDGSAWVSGGVYNSFALETDKTFLVEGAAADAKETGKRFLKTPYFKANLTNANLNEIFSNSIYMLQVGTYTYENLPDGASGVMYLVSMNNTMSGTEDSVGWQILYGSTGRIWTRRYVSHNWNAWYSIDDKIDTKVDSAITQLAHEVDAAFLTAIRTAGVLAGGDLDAITTNSVYSLNVSEYTFQHLPEGASGVMYLMTIRATDASGWQIAYGSVGRIWTRRMTVNGWDAWYSLDDRIERQVGGRIDDLTNIALKMNGVLTGGSLDEVSANGVFVVAIGSYSYTELPDGASGVMYLMNMITSQTSGWQIAYGSVGRIWTRRMTVNGWDAWYGIYDRVVKASNVSITADNKAEYFTDFNNAPINSIYRINRGAKLDNSPYGKGMSTAAGVYDGTYRDIAGYPDGTLLTFGANSTYVTQIFVSGTISGASSGNVPPNDSIMFFRNYYSAAGWGEWHMVSNRLSPTSSNIAIRKKLIAPYLDENGKPTATDTGVPNPQYIKDDPLFFNDFDNAPNNSIYQIDLDCDESVMAHNPKPGKSSVLVTLGFSYASAHGKIQTCVAVESGKPYCFVRYGYIQSSSPYVYVWTAWKELADAAALEARIAALEARIAALEK